MSITKYCKGEWDELWSIKWDGLVDEINEKDFGIRNEWGRDN